MHDLPAGSREIYLNKTVKYISASLTDDLIVEFSIRKQNGAGSPKYGAATGGS
jgi:hypothetical protein